MYTLPRDRCQWPHPPESYEKMSLMHTPHLRCVLTLNWIKLEPVWWSDISLSFGHVFSVLHGWTHSACLQHYGSIFFVCLIGLYHECGRKYHIYPHTYVQVKDTFWRQKKQSIWLYILYFIYLFFFLNIYTEILFTSCLFLFMLFSCCCWDENNCSMGKLMFWYV